MQVGHDVRTDLQLVVDANGALKLELLNAKAEVVHGDGVVGVADVDVKNELFKRPGISLGNALSCSRDISPKNRKSKVKNSILI